MPMFPIIIMEIADDDDRAYAQHLYDAYHMMMLRVARGILQNADEAEDAVSDAFVALIRHLQTVRALEETARRAYIAISVKSASLMMLRKKPEAGTSLDDDMLENLLQDPEPPPDERAIVTFELDTMRRAIDMLSPVEQVMLYRKVIEKKMDVEVAQELGCKPQTIRTRYVRLRRKLRRLCSELVSQTDE